MSPAPNQRTVNPSCKHRTPKQSINVPPHLSLPGSISPSIREASDIIKQIVKDYLQDRIYFRDIRFHQVFTRLYNHVSTANTLLLPLKDFFAEETNQDLKRVTKNQEPLTMPNLFCRNSNFQDMLQLAVILELTAARLDILQTYVTNISAEFAHQITLILAVCKFSLAEVFDNLSIFGQKCNEHIAGLPGWPEYLKYPCHTVHESHRVAFQPRKLHGSSCIIMPECNLSSASAPPRKRPPPDSPSSPSSPTPGPKRPSKDSGIADC